MHANSRFYKRIALFTASAMGVGLVSLLIAAPPKGVPSNTWSLFGNIRSNPDEDYLGTADEVGLSLCTHDEERMRFSAHGQATIKADTTITGTTTLEDTLDVDGATNLNSTLEVDGATTLNSDLSVSGTTTLNTLYVTGYASIPELNTSELTFIDLTAETITVTGGANAAEPLLDVQGRTRTDILEIEGGADIAEPFDVSGSVAA